MRLMTRIDIDEDASNKTVTALIKYLKRELNYIDLTRGKRSLLFEYPSDIDTIRLSEMMENMPTDLRKSVKHINLFEEAA